MVLQLIFAKKEYNSGAIALLFITFNGIISLARHNIALREDCCCAMEESVSLKE
jgi:hypothetical protein